MNNNIVGSASLGQDTSMAPSNGPIYSSDHWNSMSPYGQPSFANSPMSDFGAFGGYLHHGLPSESISRMAPPHPVQPQTQHPLIQPAPHMGHHHLPMLNTQWPSQLANPTTSGSFSAPPLSIPPLPAVEMPRMPIQYEKARKTLTAEQKRAMCQYHEDFPGTRQADIGAKFGVERSTVSKVLRHKDQYLKRDPEPEHATGKRGKGKNPDFDRTLSNYVRRQQQRGFDVKDEEIMEQARLLAHGSSNQESLLTNINSGWLQKFKQKHGIGAGRLMRRASETNIPDSVTFSTAGRTFSADRTSSMLSPISPTRQLSPLSGSRSDEDMRTDGLDYDFPYRAAGSHSSSTLASDLRENSAAYSGEPISPTAPAPEGFHFAEPHVGPFSVDKGNIPLDLNAPSAYHSGKRSHTFPSINIDFINEVSHEASVRDPDASQHSSAMGSPSNERHGVPFSYDVTLTSPPGLRRSGSNSSLTLRSNIASSGESTVSSTADSSPITPTPEDARRAAQTLLTYLQGLTSNGQAGQFDQNEYMAVVQLTRKIQTQHQASRPPIGGLSRIPEGDGETQVSPDALVVM